MEFPWGVSTISLNKGYLFEATKRFVHRSFIESPYQIAYREGDIHQGGVFGDGEDSE